MENAFYITYRKYSWNEFDSEWFGSIILFENQFYYLCDGLEAVANNARAHRLQLELLLPCRSTAYN